MKTFTVSQINRIIKDLIDNEVILEDIIVSGELSSFSITRGIAYFTLKDNETMLTCIQFGAKSSFNIGDMVQCRGNIKYYSKTGKLSFNVLTIELCGQGELYKKFIELKEKLTLEGLFDETHKQSLPRFINSIGVVTSKTGAVLQDIKNVSLRRNPNLDIYVYDAQVQGNLAVEQVIEGINYFDNYSDVDVIVVARGGGSIEDLMPFNDEKLARVAYNCNKPIISAVVHETDFSILDFVADLRAPTPSAAAELVTYENRDLIRRVKDIFNTIETNVLNRVQNYNERTNLVISEIEREISDVVNNQTLYINSLLNRYDKLIENKIDNTKYRVDILLNTLDRLNPAKILSSGYSYVTKDEKPIDSNINVGDTIDIRANLVKLKAQVNSKEIL